MYCRIAASNSGMRTLFSLGSFIHHVSLNVKDLDRSIEFYRDTLGLKLLAEPEDYPNCRLAWFQLSSGQQLHLIQSLDGGEPQAIDTRSSHLAMTVPDIEAAREFIAGLEAPTVNYYGNNTFVGQAYLVDPDGHVIEASQIR